MHIIQIESKRFEWKSFKGFLLDLLAVWRYRYDFQFLFCSVMWLWSSPSDINALFAADCALFTALRLPDWHIEAEERQLIKQLLISWSHSLTASPRRYLTTPPAASSARLRGIWLAEVSLAASPYRSACKTADVESCVAQLFSHKRYQIHKLLF